MNLRKSLSPAEAVERDLRITEFQAGQGRPDFEEDRDIVLNRVMLTGVNDIEQRAQLQLEAEVLRALVTAKYLKKELAQIAKWNGVSYESILEVAKRLAKERGLDIEQCEFDAMVRQYAAIEELADEGLREWKLQELAKTYRRSKREITEAYQKALARQKPIVPLKLKDIKELASKGTDKWAVQGWFPLGISILFHAHGGTGKTLFMYGVAAAIAHGYNWNGYPTTQGRVLILQCEEPPNVIAERMDDLNIGDDDPNVDIYQEWRAENKASLEKLLQTAAESGNPYKFVLIDSITAINANLGYQEKDTEYARPVRQVNEMAGKYGCCAVLIHHSNAAGGARGTTDLHDGACESWAFSTANETTGQRLLRVIKCRMGRPPGRYLFDFDQNNKQFT